MNPSHGLSWEKSGEQEGVFATLFILTGKLNKIIELDVAITKGQKVNINEIDNNILFVKVFGQDSSYAFCAEGLLNTWSTNMYYTNRMIQFRVSNGCITCGEDTFSQAKITKIILIKNG